MAVSTKERSCGAAWLQLAAENRGTGGYFDLLKLVRILRLDFELRDHPDYEVDSEILIGQIPEGRFRSPSELSDP